MTMRCLFVFLVATGCKDTASDDTGTASDDTGDSPVTDDDGDGFTVEDGDCDDADDGVNPGAYDVPDNGIDEDCDGQDATAGGTTGETTTGGQTTGGETTGGTTGGGSSGGGVDKDAEGCGCSTGGGGALGFVPLLMAVLVARRRAH